MPKILLGLTVLFLALSAVFGVLNTNKSRNLREIAARSDTARAEAERARVAKERELKSRETKVAEASARSADTEAKVASAEADLVKSQSEKSELQSELRLKQDQIAQLQQKLDEPAAKELMPDTLPMPGAGDLQAQLEDMRKQLDSAEREKQLLSQEIHGKPDRSTKPDAPRTRRATTMNPHLRGTVLAVNQAYNFVVLSLGGRQGVQADSEMLVLRGGTLIGRIRVSSVEPATAIGDIVSSSLARGVQVQPGDIVIYAGTNS